MTKKDFAAFADAFASANVYGYEHADDEGDQAQLELQCLKENIIAIFKKENPRFDEQQFWDRVKEREREKLQ